MQSACLLELKDAHSVLWGDTQHVNIHRSFTKKLHRVPLRLLYT